MQYSVRDIQCVGWQHRVIYSGNGCNAEEYKVCMVIMEGDIQCEWLQCRLIYSVYGCNAG